MKEFVIQKNDSEGIRNYLKSPHRAIQICTGIEIIPVHLLC